MAPLLWALRTMATLGLTLECYLEGCVILVAVHVFRQREEKMTVVEK